jgi:hypothetical protein
VVWSEVLLGKAEVVSLEVLLERAEEVLMVNEQGRR